MAVLNVPYIERIDKKVTPSIGEVKEVLREEAARLSLLMGYVPVDEMGSAVPRHVKRASI
jgi:hypothetical protein